MKEFSITDDILYTVVYLGKNKKGQHQLSRKAVLEERRNGGKKSNREEKKVIDLKQDEVAQPAPEMSQEEINVIAQAIEGISEL